MTLQFIGAQGESAVAPQPERAEIAPFTHLRGGGKSMSLSSVGSIPHLVLLTRSHGSLPPNLSSVLTNSSDKSTNIGNWDVVRVFAQPDQVFIA